MLKAIIWDMDGTLVDSEPLWEEATFALSEALGPRFTREQRAQTVGTNFDFTFELAARNGGHDPADLDRDHWREFMYSKVIALMEEKLIFRPGVPELLRLIQESHLPMAIATNTERAVAKTPFQHLEPFGFDAMVCGDDVEKPKPAPEMYQVAAQRLGVTPQECLVFEDSLAGMQGAVAAGARVVGLPENSTLSLPEQVVPMRELHGGIEFHGVDISTLERWYEHCVAHQKRV